MEQYFCDSAAEWTDNPGNELRRADAAHAWATCWPSGGNLELSLPRRHAVPRRPGGARRRPHRRPRRRTTARSTSRCAPRGPTCATGSTATPSRPAAACGCSTGSSTSTTTTTWRSGSACTRATGRWSSCGCTTAHRTSPSTPSTARPRSARGRRSSKVAGDPNRPMVYVARGSHASYFEPGFHETEAWYDLADGKRNSPRTDAGDRRRRRAAVDRAGRALGRHPRAGRRHRPAEPARAGGPRAVDATPRAARHRVGAPAQGRRRRRPR